MTLLLVFVAAGCAGKSIAILTSAPGDAGGCYLSFAEGELVKDPDYGTAIVDGNATTPVRWPRGYSGRESGSEVEVLDASGKVMYKTGTRVHIGGGYEGENPTVWVACGLIYLN